MTLSNGICNQSYTVKNINLAPDAKRRFEILGLTHNSTICILGCKKNGSVIAKIRGTRFAIGADFAKGIEITPKQTSGFEEPDAKGKIFKEAENI